MAGLENSFNTPRVTVKYALYAFSIDKDLSFNTPRVTVKLVYMLFITIIYIVSIHLVLRLNCISRLLKFSFTFVSIHLVLRLNVLAAGLRLDDSFQYTSCYG